MRDPKRIPKIMLALYEYWSLNPDLRLCQIIGNFFGTGDHYYVEDDILLQKLKDIIKLGDKYWDDAKRWS